MTELEEWKQAASVEAGLRGEFQEKREKLREALVKIAAEPFSAETVLAIANSALDADR